MKCPHCQREISDAALGCPYCWKDIQDNGSKPEMKCQKCGKEIPEGTLARDGSMGGWDNLVGETVLYKTQTAGSWIIGYAGIFFLTIFLLIPLCIVIAEACGFSLAVEESIVNTDTQSTQPEGESPIIGMVSSIIWGIFILGAFFRWSYRELRFYHGTYYLATPTNLWLGIDFLWEKKVQKLFSWNDVVSIVAGEKTTVFFGNGKHISLRDRTPELFDYLYSIWQNSINPHFDNEMLWIQRAQDGDKEAQFNLALSINRGDAPSYQRVDYWLRKSAEQGFAPAEYVLAVHENSSADITESIELIKKSAEQNYAPALYYLAKLYFNGVNPAKGDSHFEVNPSKGVECLCKAIEQKYAHAFVELGICYITGRGVEKNVEKAIENWRTGADLGEESGEHNLGMLYEMGEDVPQNMQEAIKWYRRAAEQGFAPAQTKLGMLYITGKDIDKDNVEGARWLTRAAEQNDPEALYYLALCYQCGDGVEKDDKLAFNLLYRAAEQGYPEAQYVLSTLCNDKNEEIKWLKLAAEQGHAQAKETLEKYEK